MVDLNQIPPFHGELPHWMDRMVDLTQRLSTKGLHLETALVAMTAALDALETDNDPASAAQVLRTCLRKFGRLPG